VRGFHLRSVRQRLESSLMLAEQAG